MAISDLIGKLFSSNFIAGVEQNTPILSLANDRSSEVSQRGDGLVIGVTQDLVSVTDYPAAGTDITYSGLNPSKIEFTLDKKKYIAFGIEDIDSAQLSFDLFSEAARQAGLEFAKQLSADLRATIAAATPAETYENEIPTNADDKQTREDLHFTLLDMKQKLITDGYNAVPVVLMHPSTWKRLMKYIISDNGSSLPTVANRAFIEGSLSAIYGLDIIVDWGATIDATDENDNADTYAFIRGRTLTYAGQLSRVERMRSSGRFATNWRGLQTYGSLIQEPRSLLKLEQTVKS